jgi:hypothetical protein
VTSLSESSQGEVGDNREKWGDFWEKSIAINRRTTKRLSRTSTFLVSCPKGQVEKYVNVEA